MSLLDDIAAAKALVEADKQRLALDQAALDTLVASAVVGGPDVSSFQGDVDWTKVKGAGYDHVFVKVSDGDVLDPTYTAARLTSIRNAGLSFAPYYYARVAGAGNNFRTPRTEAAMAYYFASKQGWGKPTDLPLVYDVEANSGESTTFQGQSPLDAAKHVIGFVNRYRDLTGHYPFIYTFPAAWKIIVGQFSDTSKATLAKCPLWIAHYGVDTPSVPQPWTDWTFWQFTDAASVPGVTGACDLSRANITKANLDPLRIP